MMIIRLVDFEHPSLDGHDKLIIDVCRARSLRERGRKRKRFLGLLILYLYLRGECEGEGPAIFSI